MSLLKCGFINSANTQPTQSYSWNFKAAVLSEHFSHWLNACVDISLLLISHVNTQSEKTVLHKQYLSSAHIYHTHRHANCHSHCRQAVSFASLCLFDVWFQPHPCDPVKQVAFLRVELDVFRPFVSQCFL